MQSVFIRDYFIKKVNIVKYFLFTVFIFSGLSLFAKIELNSNLTIKGRSYKVLALLGDGAFGSVFKVQDNLTGDIWALKAIDITAAKFNEEKLNQIRYGEAKLKQLMSLDKDHRLEYLPLIYENFVDQSDKHFYHFYLSKMGDADLDSKIKYELRFEDSTSEKIKTAYNVFKSVMKDILVLKNYGFVHTDIKPQNIIFKNSIGLIDYDSVLSLNDLIDLDLLMVTEGRVSLSDFQNSRIDVLTSIYSLAVALIEILDPELSYLKKENGNSAEQKIDLNYVKTFLLNMQLSIPAESEADLEHMQKLRRFISAALEPKIDTRRKFLNEIKSEDALNKLFQKHNAEINVCLKLFI